MTDTSIETDPFRYLRPQPDDGCDENTLTCGETMSRGKPHENAEQLMGLIGAAAGVSAEVSVALKKDGDTIEACGHVGFEVLTIGACVPFSAGGCKR